MRTFGLIGSVVWIVIIALIGNDRFTRTELVHGEVKKRFIPFFAIIAVLPIILWAGFRSGNGYVDTNAYIEFYETIPGDMPSVFSYIKEYYPKDPGFTLFTGIVKTIFGNSYMPYLLMLALIQGLAVTFFFRKYSDYYVISMFLFIASAECFSWMFNGMRQFFAVTLMLAAFPFYLDKKYVKYGIFVALACSIHFTAIIMIPIAIIAKGKPWNFKTIFMLLVAVMAIVATNRFTNIMDVAVQSTQYSDSISSWIEAGDNGTNPIRVLVHAIPTLLAFVGKESLEKIDDPVLNICINMSIISTSMWLISMVTSGIYMGRMPIYASLFNYILLPYEVNMLFNERSAKIMNVAMVALYLMFYYYQLHFVWGVI